jgi:hypothetical protein
MRSRTRRLGLLVVAMSMIAVQAPAGAHPDGDGLDHEDGGPIAGYASRENTKNLKAMGHAVHQASFPGPINSDLAFWGKYAIQGNYDGFRVIDIKAPGNPKVLSHPSCEGDQGDIYVYEHIVVRAWNSPAPEGRTCGGEEVPEGFEGVHVFSIADPANPVLLTSVEFSQAGAAERGTALGCGSHTVTGVPDLDSGRLIVYSNNSSGSNLPECDAMDVIEVPLDDPELAEHIGKVALTGGSLGSNNGCHDAGVILGDANLLVCASGHAANVFSIGGERGGSLEEPQFLYTIEEEDDEGNKVGVGGRWHSASFSWDGEVLVLGWEPGGGGQAQCETDDPDLMKSLFFYDSATGEKLGQWVLPRGQDTTEEEGAQNCTVHNFNMVPLRSGRDVLVGGHYQAGTWVVDFTGVAQGVEPTTVAYSDPSGLGPGRFCGQTPPGCQLGGAWSTYYYNNFIFESEIQTGLNVFRFSGRELAGAMKLPYLNPQTQPFTIG